MAAKKTTEASSTAQDISHVTDSNRPSIPKEIKKTTIGGQALIEGLMMVGPKRISMAIRKADGSIYVEEIAQGRKMVFFEKVPFFRGGIRLFRQLVTGTGALMKSAEISEETPPAAAVLPVDADASTDGVLTGTAQAAVTSTDTPESIAVTAGSEDQVSSEAKDARSPAKKPKAEAKPGRLDAFLEKHFNLMIVIFAFIGIMFSIVLFILVPRLIVDFVSNWIPGSQSKALSVVLTLNLVEGLLRIIIFVGYLMLTSRIKDIARVWMYHGAEHKTIACFEAGEPLTVENVRKFSRFHPRCGTAFLFIVIIVSILVFSVVGALIGVNFWWLNLLIRLAFMPVVAGIAYEIIHFTGKHDKNPICRSVSGPGLWMQRFTTREPDDGMLEVAIAAVVAVLPEREGEDAW
jgi:uncharacterized protein YqhQ